MFKYLKDISGSISTKEKEFFLLVSVVALLLTLIPPVFGWLNKGDNYFTGGTLIAAADKMVYLSQMEEARQGNFTVHNLYTSEPQIGYISPLWVTLGWISRITTLNTLVVYHLFRVVLGFILLYLLYLFLSQVFSEVKWRKLAFLSICFVSGLGFLTVMRPWTYENFAFFGSDIWFSEGVTFLTLYHSPLFILSQIFILIGLWWFLIRFQTAKLTEISLMGLFLAFLGLFHTYDIVIVIFVTFAWYIRNLIFEKKFSWLQVFKLVLLYAIAFLSVIYFLILKTFSPGFAGWAVQNVTLSPRPINYIIGYGFIFILFIIGLRHVFKNTNLYWQFLAIWAVVQWFLLYLPSQFQRKLGNGLHIPMVLVGIIGLFYIWNRIKDSNYINELKNRPIALKVLIFFAIIILSGSNIFMLGGEFFYHYRKAFYLSVEEKQAMDWLRSNLTKHDVILSQNFSGSIIPSITGKYVYLGHGHQTNNWTIKKYEVENWFFGNNNFDSAKQKWLKRENITYIYFSAWEDQLGDYQPETKDYLKTVFNDGVVKILKVI